MTRSKIKKLIITIILLLGVGLGIFAIVQESGFFDGRSDAWQYHTGD